ncbi:hypothetical protein GCM10011506_48010 [Marivirga lumbricoides]|uniref:Core-binding (CB) domain-containing protein n=1 Tax=Marivirga lumbricoides TaxID=1046115 RepID=A0ABQ1N741_9BACT|nr:hypothetical protein GCM10011506_48010 [Marivirga lumbricoides]
MNKDKDILTTGFRSYLESKGYTNSGIEGRLTVLKRYRRWLEEERLEAEQVTYNDLLGFMKWCKSKGAIQRTIQNYIGVIKHLYEHLIREGKVERNPATDIEVKGIKRKILYHILEPHELHALYNLSCHIITAKAEQGNIGHVSVPRLKNIRALQVRSERH